MLAPAFALLLTTSLAQAAGDLALPSSALPPPPPPPVAQARAVPRFGLAAEGGAPDGLELSALWRPVSALRLWAGPSFNGALGAHAGVTFAPWRWALSPTLSAEVGRYFSSDLTWITRRDVGVPPEVEPLLRDVSYGYGSLQLGLELGSPLGLTFSLRAGLSYFSLVARGTATTTPGGGGSTTTVEITDPRITAVVPSLKLGVQYWF